MIFDKDGLKAEDYIIRDRIVKKLQLNSNEQSSVTRALKQWHRGWAKVVNSSQAKFNRMRRLQEANEHGDCFCCCTGKWYPFTDIDAGHFISATKQNTRFLPSNVHPQSKHSNNHHLGDDAKIFYTIFMTEKYGRAYIETLLKDSKKKKQWGKCKEELIAMRCVWNRNIKQEERRLGL